MPVIAAAQLDVFAAARVLGLKELLLAAAKEQDPALLTDAIRTRMHTLATSVLGSGIAAKRNTLHNAHASDVRA